MGDRPHFRSAGIREPHGEGAGPVIGGERQRGTVRRPPWLAAFARLVSNLPRLRSIRAHRPEMTFPPLREKKAMRSRDDQAGPKLQYAGSETGVIPPLAR